MIQPCILIGHMQFSLYELTYINWNYWEVTSWTPRACSVGLWFSEETCDTKTCKKKNVFSDNKLSEASGGEINSSEQNDLEDRDGDEELENGVMDAVPVDENLFTGEDLDELEEELNTLDLEEWI